MLSEIRRLEAPASDMYRSSSTPCARTRQVATDAMGRPAGSELQFPPARTPNSQIVLEPLVTRKRSKKERVRPTALDPGLSPFTPSATPQPVAPLGGGGSSSAGAASGGGLTPAGATKCSGSAPRLPAIAVTRRPSFEDPPPLPVILGNNGLLRRPSNEDCAKSATSLPVATPTPNHRRTGPFADSSQATPVYGSESGNVVFEGGVNSARPKMTEARQRALATELEIAKSHPSCHANQAGKCTPTRRELSVQRQQREREVYLQYGLPEHGDEVADVLPGFPLPYPEPCRRVSSAPTPTGPSVATILEQQASWPCTEPSTPASSCGGKASRKETALFEQRMAPANHESPGILASALRRAQRRHKTWNQRTREEDRETTATPSSVTGSTTMSMGGDSPGSASRATPPSVCEGILGLDWKRGSKIGSGSYGCVHQALSCATGRIFAVKETVFDDTESDSKLRKTLAEELDICKSLRHPNIVSYLGHDYLGSKLFIYLEYVPGGSMSSILKEFGPLDKNPLRIATRGLLEGLNYLHTRPTPVVHRDIKGANVLVDLHFQVKLADFGCSKRSTDTKSLTTVGSVPWMAPEVINHKEGHGRKADIWSLGCTVIEMATAEKPWGDGAFDNVLYGLKHIGMSNATPPVPETLDVDLRGFLGFLIKRDPDARPCADEALQHDFLTSAGASSAPSMVSKTP